LHHMDLAQISGTANAKALFLRLADKSLPIQTFS